MTEIIKRVEKISLSGRYFYDQNPENADRYRTFVEGIINEWLTDGIVMDVSTLSREEQHILTENQESITQACLDSEISFEEVFPGIAGNTSSEKKATEVRTVTARTIKE